MVYVLASLDLDVASQYCFIVTGAYLMRMDRRGVELGCRPATHVGKRAARVRAWAARGDDVSGG